MRKSLLHFLEYILVLPIYTIIRLVNIDTASNIGATIARIIAPLTSATGIARKNIKYVFPKLSDKDVEEIIKKMWDNIGRTMAELPHINTISDKEFSSRVQISTTKHIKNINTKRATICLSGHFGNWEAAANTLLKYNENISIVYRDANNPLVNHLYLSMKGPKFHNIPKGNKGVKDIIEAVKQRHFICFLPDQKLNQGLKVPFFNKPAMTPSAPMKLALKFNLPILFGHSIRTKGAHFKIYLDGPYEIDELLGKVSKDEDKELLLTKIYNKKVEQWILDNPEQWFWVHRRWNKRFYQ